MQQGAFRAILRNMISASHRFHGHKSLNYLYRNAKTVRGPLIALKYTPNRTRSAYRLAVVVSKKISKSAVVRNRIRRRIYETFRAYEGEVAPQCDMVMTVFSDLVATMPATELDTVIRAQLIQAGVLERSKAAPQEKTKT